MGETKQVPAVMEQKILTAGTNDYEALEGEINEAILELRQKMYQMSSIVNLAVNNELVTIITYMRPLSDEEVSNEEKNLLKQDVKQL